MLAITLKEKDRNISCFNLPKQTQSSGLGANQGYHVARDPGTHLDNCLKNLPAKGGWGSGEDI